MWTSEVLGELTPVKTFELFSTTKSLIFLLKKATIKHFIQINLALVSSGHDNEPSKKSFWHSGNLRNLSVYST